MSSPGHSYGRPLGDLKSGTARISSSKAAVEFEVDLPDEADMPSYFSDAVKQIRQNLVAGISPGFRVPPASAVASAEALKLIRAIRASASASSIKPSCMNFRS